MRPKAAAGLAKEVEEVNQYAAPIYVATIAATRDDGARRITSSRPAVATASASSWPKPCRGLSENCNTDRSNIAFASQPPQAAPASCTTT